MTKSGVRIPDQLLQVDNKKRGRVVLPNHRGTGDRRDSVSGAGFEVAHVFIDDHSREGFLQMHPDEKKFSAAKSLKAAVAHYQALGVSIKRLITENGVAFRSQLFPPIW